MAAVYDRLRRSVRPVGAALLAGVVLLGIGLAWPLPEGWTAPAEHRRVVDRNGAVLLERAMPERGRSEWVELGQVAPVVVDALLAAEDDRFHQHPGVDPWAIGRAARANWRAGRVVQGGSTLTQQTARLMAGRPPGLWGKGVEAWRAVRLELHLGKREILTQVLNRSWFGAGAAGIEAAATEFFGEHASGLSVSEAATLVALLPAPERLDPRRSRRAAMLARDRVIERMVDTGRLDRETADRALREPLQLARPDRPGTAPHLAVHLLSTREGTVVQTTVDRSLQQDVEAIVADVVGGLRHRDVDHGAVLVVHVPTSEVRAWVGSADWRAPDGQIDGVRTRRSPGSTLKPFLYGVAFEQGLRPGDVLADLPVRYDTPHGTWSPGNYGGTIRGPVRAREALASSMNLPAVALLDEVGVATLHRRLEQAGIRLTAPARTYGLGLALGDAEIGLIDLATAYAGLARGGVHRPLKLGPDDPSPETRFLSADAAWMVQDILSDPQARLAGFGRHGVLERRYDSATKTGTSQGFRDNWTVGWAGDWLVAAWVGNFDARPMGHVSGVTGAGPLWAQVMDRLVGEQRPRFGEPEGWVKHEVCALSGEGRAPHCPHGISEWLPPAAEPRAPCTWHQSDGSVAWPAAFAEWAHDRRAHPYAEEVAGSGRPAITWPSDGAELHVDPRIPAEHRAVGLRATAPSGAREAVWTVDGERLATVGPPFHVSWPDPAKGAHRVELVVDGEPAAAVQVHIR